MRNAINSFQALLLTDDSVKDRRQPHRIITILLLASAYSIGTSQLVYLLIR
jgi:hypothetical protein